MQFKIKKNKYRFKSLFIFIFFFTSYYLFFLSLEGCFEGEDFCCMKWKWMKIKIVEELLSCFIMIILFELMILNKLDKLHLIHIVVVFTSFYIYSHGIEFDDHGHFNIKYYFVILGAILIILIFSKFLLSIKKKGIIILYICIIIISLYLLKNLTYNYIDCKEWIKGLNKTFLDNNKEKYGCQIKIPKWCPFKLGKYLFDGNKICKNIQSDPRSYLIENSKSPYINKNTFHVGYPLVNKNENLFPSRNFTSLKKYFLNNLIDMNNETILKSLNDQKPEISVDFSKNKFGNMNINVNFNKTLSDERKKLEKFTNPYSKNIMVLYFDSVSRAYSIRQLRKTLKFFEKFMPYKGNYHPKYSSENFHSFQFFKYHSLHWYTVGNYPVLYYGNFRNKNNKLITLTLKKNGFITGYSADNCFIDFTNSFHDFSFDDIYDHQFLMCDPNKKLASSKLNCLYEKIHLEYMFEYIEQFWRKYKENRKFITLLTNFAHEGSLEMLKYMDNITYNYFNNLFNDNLLKETSIFLLSDHGVGVPSIYYLNDFFKYELVLPLFYLLINDRKGVDYEKQYKYLKTNQQTFITGFDIYNTIVNIIYGDSYEKKNANNSVISRYGKSLFKEINQTQRSPKIYNPMEKYACV